jgi:hypothetical protein
MLRTSAGRDQRASSDVGHGRPVPPPVGYAADRSRVEATPRSPGRPWGPVRDASSVRLVLVAEPAAQRGLFILDHQPVGPEGEDAM